MRKIIILIIIIIIIILGYLNIPNYNELNNLIIIDKIIIIKNEIVLREKYISKEDNNQTYKYNYYKITEKRKNNIEKSFNNKYHKKAYIKKAKYINRCTKK